MTDESETLTTQQGLLELIRAVVHEEMGWSTIGYAANILCRATMDRPDVHVELLDGRLFIGEQIVGIATCELSADDYLKAATFVLGMPGPYVSAAFEREPDRDEFADASGGVPSGWDETV